MIKSKGWNWNIVTDDKAEMWKNPSIESYIYYIVGNLKVKILFLIQDVAQVDIQFYLGKMILMLVALI